jgi:hypothetical protein
MQRVIESLAQPRTMKDSLLGRLALDRELGWFEARRKTKTFDYRVYVDVLEPDNDKKVAKAIARARLIVQAIERDIGNLRRAISHELLELYNTEWRTGGRPMTRSAFERKQVLEAVEVSSTMTTLKFRMSRPF